MATVDLEKIGIRYRGDWDASASYEPLDYVKYTNGNGYISLVANRGITPTNSSTWALSVKGGGSAGNTIVEHSSSETSVQGLAWDVIHVFPVMSSLSFTLGLKPNDNYEHSVVIEFQTPSDITNFTLTTDSGLLWSDNLNISSSLYPNNKYIIDISSESMIALYHVQYKSNDGILSLDSVALPLGGKYRISLLNGLSNVYQAESSNPSVASVGNGYIHGISQGTATVTFIWGQQRKDVTFYVGQEVIDTASIPQQERVIDEIEIINPISELSEGDEYALYAVGISNNKTPKYTIYDYNPIVFSSSNSSIASVEFGTLCAHKKGSCVITASDLNNNASKSFNLTVTDAIIMPNVAAAETYIPEIDNTGETDVTADIANAFAYASTNGYKKISFLKGKYLMNADNRPNNAGIDISSNMIVDFNGSEIYFAVGTATTSGYVVFQIVDKVNIWLCNVKIFAENYGRTSLIHKESDRTLQISGTSRNIHIINSEFNWSPGFNVGISYSRNHISSFSPNKVKAGNVEAGGFDDYGQPIEQEGTFRMAVFVTTNLTSGGWVLGQYQGYQVPYMTSRLYDICFYDADKNFLFMKRNCYVYQRYEFPEGVTPKYCKIAFFQDAEPTGYDGDYFAFIMIADVWSPRDIYFKDCTFSNNWSTGLSPQGGTHVVVDHCKFIDNGRSDPSSHIDWEDGRQNSQGHIVRYCDFIGNKVKGQTTNGYCRNITIHDCYFENGSFSSGSESVMQRTYHNVFNNTSVSMSSKADHVFAGNLLNTTPTLNNGVEGTFIISVDNKIIT